MVDLKRDPWNVSRFGNISIIRPSNTNHNLFHFTEPATVGLDGEERVPLKKLYERYEEDVKRGNAMPPEVAKKLRDDFVRHCGAFKQPADVITPEGNEVEDFRSFPDRFAKEKQEPNEKIEDILELIKERNSTLHHDLALLTNNAARSIYNNAIATVVDNTDLDLEDELKIAQVLNDVIEITARQTVELFEVGQAFGLDTTAMYQLGEIITDEFIDVGKEVDAKLNLIWETVNT